MKVIIELAEHDYQEYLQSRTDARSWRHFSEKLSKLVKKEEIHPDMLARDVWALGPRVIGDTEQVRKFLVEMYEAAR